VHTLAFIGLKSGLVGVSLLAAVYVGMGIIGAYHGHGLHSSDELFRLVSFAILGARGAAIISVAVLMACFSTAIALGTVLADYVQNELFNNRISYIMALIITLLLCIPLSTVGLGYVLRLTGGPITYVGYPMLITLTFCNIAYKLYGFTYVKTPVLLTFIIALLCYVVV
jgi:branched-chain amino acid:cation transporter, LIVCS family